MKNDKICYQEYELEDGMIVAMSTAPVLLLKLRGKKDYKTAYEKLSKMLVSGADEKDVMSIYEFLYGTYVCANQDDEDVMSFREFIENANQDYEYNMEVMKGILKPEKKKDSEKPSEEQQEEERQEE